MACEQLGLPMRCRQGMQLPLPLARALLRRTCPPLPLPSPSPPLPPRWTCWCLATCCRGASPRCGRTCRRWRWMPPPSPSPPGSSAASSTACPWTLRCAVGALGRRLEAGGAGALQAACASIHAQHSCYYPPLDLACTKSHLLCHPLICTTAFGIPAVIGRPLHAHPLPTPRSVGPAVLRALPRGAVQGGTRAGGDLRPGEADGSRVNSFDVVGSLGQAQLKAL